MKNANFTSSQFQNGSRKKLKKSILGRHEIQKIWNGIDINVFKPHDKVSVRKELGLPLDKKIIGFGIKGFIDSNKIVDNNKNLDNLFFLSIGHSHIKTENKNIKATKHIEDKELLSKYFSALDVFFYPSRGDTFGLTSAEVMASGTPVVVYAIDALPEIVSHKETGYIANYIDIHDAQKGIDYILNLSNEEHARMCTKARFKVIEKFSLDRMYAEYLTLYKRILKEKSI